jgi:hypothetical protein
MALPASAQRFEIGRTVNRTFGAIGSNFVVFLLLSILLAAIPFALIGLGYAYISTYVLVWGGVVATALLPFAVLALQMIPTYVLIGALTHGSIVHYRGARASFGECLATGFRLLLPLIGLGILTFIGLMLWLLVVGIPGIFVASMLVGGFATSGMTRDPIVILITVIGVYIVAAIPVVLALIRWSVSAPSLVVESPGIFGAFKRSGDLTRGARWKIFFLGLVYVVIWVLIQTGITFLGSSILLGFDAFYAYSGWVLLGITVLYSALNTMIAAAGQAALYYELRVSKEGATSDELARVFE